MNCIHGLTTDSCATCIENDEALHSVYADQPHDKPIHEGMTEIDLEAGRLGRSMRGFAFDKTSRRGASGGRSRNKSTPEA